MERYGEGGEGKEGRRRWRQREGRVRKYRSCEVWQKKHVVASKLSTETHREGEREGRNGERGADGGEVYEG